MTITTVWMTLPFMDLVERHCTPIGRSTKIQIFLELQHNLWKIEFSSLLPALLCIALHNSLAWSRAMSLSVFANCLLIKLQITIVCWRTFILDV